SADQPAHPLPADDEAGTAHCMRMSTVTMTPRMTQGETLAELLANNRAAKRTISYLETENAERVVSYAELYERALGILFHLQKLGARPGDKLIIYLSNNEQFLDAFWAGMLGGIVPVPV